MWRYWLLCGEQVVTLNSKQKCENNFFCGYAMSKILNNTWNHGEYGFDMKNLSDFFVFFFLLYFCNTMESGKNAAKTHVCKKKEENVT